MNYVQIPIEMLLPNFYLHQQTSCQYFFPNHIGNWEKPYLKKKILEIFHQLREE
jgi:hypothetical protein